MKQTSKEKECKTNNHGFKTIIKEENMYGFNYNLTYIHDMYLS